GSSHVETSKPWKPKVTEKLVEESILLITKINFLDDIALQIAVRAVQKETSTILSNKVKSPEGESIAKIADYIKMKNNRGNTTLHEALRAFSFKNLGRSSKNTSNPVFHSIISNERNTPSH
ncbi:unnamed protein product, partial [Dovyalis caffra]